MLCIAHIGAIFAIADAHSVTLLRCKDLDRRARGQPARYWIIEDIDEFVQEYRANTAEIATVPWATYDFTTMYEALEHTALIEGCMVAASDAWKHQRRRVAAESGSRVEDVRLALSAHGWAEEDPSLEDSPHMWYTEQRLREALTYMLDRLYILNGGVLRKQVKGVPMGLNCAGQLANAYGYAVESRWWKSKRSHQASCPEGTSTTSLSLAPLPCSQGWVCRPRRNTG
jgi:hypothetical protein